MGVVANIVDFVEARLADEARAADSMPDPAKYRRIVDVLRTVAGQVVGHLEANDLEPTDNPIAAGLLVPASVWSDHPDFDPESWFPRMSRAGRR